MNIIDLAIDEDFAFGPDVTTLATIDATMTGQAEMVSRESGVIAGVDYGIAAAERCAARLGSELEIEVVRGDGAAVEPGDVVMRIRGPVQTILIAERTVLNFVSQLSGVATLTREWVRAVAGTGSRIRDTRKTVPGLRSAQKAAVVAGGGVNHRMALGDAALIKDNHIAAAGSLTRAFESVRARAKGAELGGGQAHSTESGDGQAHGAATGVDQARSAAPLTIEVECDTLAQVQEAVSCGAQLVLLDNMTPEQMREAVELCAAAGVKTEASGGLSLVSAREVAETGVDYIAIGALTHSAPVLDLGLDFKE